MGEWKQDNWKFGGESIVYAFAGKYIIFKWIGNAMEFHKNEETTSTKI